MRHFLAWFPMIAIAVANGTFRQAVLLPRLGDAHARQVSTLMLVALFALYIGWALRRWPLRSRAHAVKVGLLWLALTLAFEFGLGRFVSGLSWQEMLSEYDFSAGRLWGLVPIWVAVAPLVFHRFLPGARRDG